MVPGPDGDGPELATALAGALADLLGCPVEAHASSDYRVLLAAMEQGLVHLSWLPPLPAARGMYRGNKALVPAAVSVRGGATTYMTGLIARKAGPVQSLADLKGVRAGWVDRESAGGYQVLRAALRASGISLVSAFREDIFLRNHQEVARAVYEGRVDVGATFLRFDATDGTRVAWGGYEEAGLSHDDIRVLAHAGPIPSDVFAVHAGAAPSVLPAVQAALVDGRPLMVHNLARRVLRADGFVRPTAEHGTLLLDLLDLVDPAWSGP